MQEQFRKIILELSELFICCGSFAELSISGIHMYRAFLEISRTLAHNCYLLFLLLIFRIGSYSEMIHRNLKMMMFPVAFLICLYRQLVIHFTSSPPVSVCFAWFGGNIILSLDNMVNILCTQYYVCGIA
jgi:hypothetical protein